MIFNYLVYMKPFINGLDKKIVESNNEINK